MIFWPLWTLRILLKNHHMLDESAFKQKYGALYDGIRIGSVQPVTYIAVFSVRRFDLILVNLYFSLDSPLSGFTEMHYTVHKVFCLILI